MSDTLYVTARVRERGSGHYHTHLGCFQLDASATEVIAVARDDLGDDYDCCAVCDERDTTVYVSTRLSRSSGQHYHTDKDCPHFKSIGEYREVERAAVEPGKRECSVCAGTNTTTADKEQSTAYKTLEQADPDTIPLGGESA